MTEHGGLQSRVNSVPDQVLSCCLAALSTAGSRECQLPSNDHTLTMPCVQAHSAIANQQKNQQAQAALQDALADQKEEARLLREDKTAALKEVSDLQQQLQEGQVGALSVLPMHAVHAMHVMMTWLAAVLALATHGCLGSPSVPLFTCRGSHHDGPLAWPFLLAVCLRF